MRKSMILIFMALAVIFNSCVKNLDKEGISSTTLYKGRVIEKSENAPIQGVMVSVSDGTHVHASAVTDEDGRFEMEVSFDELNENYNLHLDCQNYPSMTEDLKGMGQEVYDYRDIVFYDKNNTENWPFVKTNSVTEISITSAKCGGKITYSGPAAITARGICWSSHSAPTVASSHTTDGSGTGSFVSVMTNLTPNKTYHVRAYAINQFGTYYGDEVLFTTDDAVPLVETTGCSNYSLTSVTTGGSIITDNGFAVTAKGVCWGTSPNPLVDGNHTTEGTGIASFSSRITGINFSNATYYVRAYATNEYGTGYGEEIVLKRNNPWGYPECTISGTTYVIHPNLSDANWSTAVSLCDNLVDVFSDWYLPTKQELKDLIVNNHSFWSANVKYWSSEKKYNGNTPDTGYACWHNGSYCSTDDFSLSSVFKVRPIRRAN